MKMLRGIKPSILACCLVALISHASLAQGSAKKEVETEFYGCESELRHLDDLALALQGDPPVLAYIIVYAPRAGSRPDTAAAYGARMKKYLITERHLESDRLTVVDGGFREKLSYELWLVPEGAQPPSPRPTVSRKSVRLRRGRTRLRTCWEILG